MSDRLNPSLSALDASSLCLTAGAYGSTLSDIAFYASCPESGPLPEGFEAAQRSRVQRDHNTLRDVSRRIALDACLRRVERDLRNFLPRLESSREDALKLVTVLTRGGKWGRCDEDWSSRTDRETAARVEEAGMWFRDLAKALDAAIEQADAQEPVAHAAPEPAAPPLKAGPKPDASNIGIPDRAVIAAYKLQCQKKTVSISAVARLAGVDRSHLMKQYPETIKLIKSIGASGGRLRRQ